LQHRALPPPGRATSRRQTASRFGRPVDRARPGRPPGAALGPTPGPTRPPDPAASPPASPAPAPGPTPAWRTGRSAAARMTGRRRGQQGLRTRPRHTGPGPERPRERVGAVLRSVTGPLATAAPDAGPLPTSPPGPGGHGRGPRPWALVRKGAPQMP